jgi:hypothetical protein
MKWIVCHNETIGPKILALCVKCFKSFIAYYKVNDIWTMKKHVEQDHDVLFKRNIKKVHACPWNFLDVEFEDEIE